MEQRRLRLGDILDDYCPRERRVTNHAVVAMIEDDVKQTRCTTCDAEHAYKGGKEPRRRKKDATSVLYEEVLAGMPDAVETAAVAPTVVHPPVLVAPEPDVSGSQLEAAAVPAAGAVEDASETLPDNSENDEPRSDVDDGPFHRRLIRATLPRPEGQKDVRQVTDFTVRHNGNGRGAGRHGGGQNNAFRGGAKMRGGAGGGNGHNPNGGRRFGPSAGPGRGPSAGPGRSAGSGRGGGRPGFGGGNAPNPRNRKRSR